MGSRRFLSFFILLGLALNLLALKVNATDEPVAVIVNKANPVSSLSEAYIKKIYTNGVLSWPDGMPITIYDLSLQDRLRAAFSEKILGMPADRVAEAWAHLKITNQAKNPPYTMKSEALILRRVAAEKGAIGYVSYSAAKNSQDVRIVNTLQ
jgi:ABC-type phosphate transport system substrate-binding protein